MCVFVCVCVYTHTQSLHVLVGERAGAEMQDSTCSSVPFGEVVALNVRELVLLVFGLYWFYRSVINWY